MQFYDPKGHRMTPERVRASLSSADLAVFGQRDGPLRAGEGSPWERINAGDIIPEKMPLHSGAYREVLGFNGRDTQYRQD